MEDFQGPEVPRDESWPGADLPAAKVKKVEVEAWQERAPSCVASGVSKRPTLKPLGTQQSMPRRMPSQQLSKCHRTIGSNVGYWHA